MFLNYFDFWDFIVLFIQKLVMESINSIFSGTYQALKV